jgi:hypothetical protein
MPYSPPDRATLGNWAGQPQFSRLPEAARLSALTDAARLKKLVPVR